MGAKEKDQLVARDDTSTIKRESKEKSVYFITFTIPAYTFGALIISYNVVEYITG